MGGVRGPSTNHWPITGAVISLEPGARCALDLPARDRAFAYVLDGHVDIAGHAASAGLVVWSEPCNEPGDHSTLELEGTHLDETSRLMVFSGPPIREHVVMGGPFV